VEENAYKSSILLGLHLILFVALGWFTVATSIDYTRNMTLGISISISIVFFYLFTLYRSAIFFNKGRIGLAYFLTIALFLVLSFAQFINCANSVSFRMH